MPSMMDLLSGALGGDALNLIGKQLGVDSDTVQSGVASALPVLLGGLAKNASDSKGAGALASALDRDHDGSVLDDLAGYLGSGSQATDAGAGILKHVLGGRQPVAEQAISKVSGMDAAKASALLKVLAPLALGALGRVKREQGLDAAGLADKLGSERKRAADAQPDAMAAITGLLDQDGDGSIVDDVAGIASKFLSGFGKR